MLVELSQALGNYLHEVFIAKFQVWVLLGYVAQLMFTMRFLVQWVASERAGKMVMPIAFWFFSIGGGLLLLAYALFIRDPVFILGQAFGVLVYARNLYFELRDRRAAAATAYSSCDIVRQALSAARPSSRSRIKSSGSSSPICRRTVGPSGTHVVVVRMLEQSNGMARLSKPPQDAPMPNRPSSFRKACTASSATGLNTTLNSPLAPEKSRCQVALPGQLARAG